jgi:hypothetical protein
MMLQARLATIETKKSLKVVKQLLNTSDKQE